jgi:hypothetical protein
MANRRFIDFPIASTVGDNDIVLIWQDGLNKQTTKGTLIQGAPTSLEGLTDVDIAGLINGQILQYNSVTGKWENVDRTGLNLSELGDVSIVSPSNGQVLVYNSTTSKWENSSAGFVPYVGAVTTVDLGAQGLRAGYVRFNTSVVSVPNEQGLMYWDGDDETIAVILNGYIMKIGEDQFYPVKNQTGSSIAKGTAVRFAGTVGASGRLLIAPFIADGSVSSSFFMGVTAEAIANGADGKVLYFGRIRGINTNAFNEGDVLYASTTVAGGFQTAVPVAPNNIVQVAAVITKSINQGVIFIRPSFGSNINQDEGVKIVSPTTGQLLQLQANGLWENKTKAQVLGGTSSQFVKGDGSLDSTAYVPTSREVIAGAGLTGGGALTGNVTLSHADTSSQASVDNSNGNVIQDVTLDTYGHITALASTNLDNRYYTETEIDSTLTNYQLRSEKGQANGYASLDSNGKVPLVQINDALIGNVNFQGLWNAATNTPTLANPPASGTKGYYYIVSTAGTFAGISFEVGDWIISNGTAWGKVDNTDAVSSVFGRTGNVTATNGDYNTSQVTELTNLYYTEARVNANTNVAANTAARHNAVTLGTANGLSLSTQVLSLGLASGSTTGALSSANWTTFNNKENAITAGTTAQYFRGDKTFQTLNTGVVPESGNLYYTDARSRAALSFVAGSGAYNSTTGVITIPTNTSQLTNGANFITLASLSAGAGISYNNTTGVIASTITQYTDALARLAISLTTTGASGASTYNNTTGVLNVPNYTLAGLGGVPTSRTITINGTTQDLSANRTFNVGTVTSVGLSAPTGFSVANSPVTGAGTLALSFASGFSLPTNASQANWDAAYNDKINSAAVTGTTTKTLTLTQQDGGTITASWTDINTDAVTSVFGRIGAVVAANGDYTTAQVTESGNLYFTNARAIASVLTGYTSGAGTISAADSILSAIQKLNGNIGALTTGVSSVNGQTGVVVLTTTNIAEGTNLYYTEARVNANTNVAANTAARHAAVTLGTANGLSLSTQQLSLGLASAGVTGALSGTDWSTFNSKQNALTNPVTGTGTTNYLPKFTGSTTIGNSLVFDNGSSVGINTITPSLQGFNNELTISSGTSGTSRTALNLQGSRTTASTFVSIGFYHQTNFVASIESSRGGADNSGNLQFFTTNAGTTGERLTLASTGEATFSSSVTAGGTITNQTSGGDAILYAKNGTVTAILIANTTGELMGIGGTESNHPYIIRTGNTERMRITSTGAATFLSSVTATQFVANGNSAGGFEGLRIVNASTGAAQILLNNSAQSWIINTRTDNQFSIFNATASSTPLLISTTDAATFSSSVTANSFIRSGGTSAQFLKADGSVDSNTYYLASNPSSFIALTNLSFVAGSGAYNSTTGVITIPTNNNQITNGAGYITSAALGAYLPLTGGTLTGALNGTSATFSGQLIFPSTSKMEGSGAPNFIIASTSAAGSGVGPYQTFKTNNSDFGYIGSKDALMSTTGNMLALLGLNGLSFHTGASYNDRLLIASNGNVGIGTISPVNYTNYKSLHISGATSTSSAILYLTNSTETIRGLFFAEGSAQRVTIGSQSDHPFTIVTNDIERFRIASTGAATFSSSVTATSATFSGNLTVDTNTLFVDSANNSVGIGTLIPKFQSFNRELTVSGGTSGTSRGAINIQGSRTTNSTFGSFAFFHQTNYVAGIESSRAGADNSGNLQFFTTNGGVTGERLTLSSTGAATFSSSVTATQFVANGNSTGGFEGLRIVNASTGAAQIVLNNSAQSWLINTRTDNHFSIFNATSSTTPFLITTGGNVLIGTETDNSNKLRVNGSIWADGAATLNGNFRIINSNGFNDSVNFDRTAINGLILNSSGNLILNGSTGSSRITCYGDGYFSGGVQTGLTTGASSSSIWLLGEARGGTVTTNATVRVEIGGVLVDLVARYV